ncbi:MAG: aromatic ring-hydroxylating dioxygenase subunit alpha [Acidobacteria bacterium]|nr:aromatic ring-hydroxylating dioxygenase subunit alpha [Acidobacteriota bacterium]
MDEGFTLPGRHYTDPQLFQQEIERIFLSMWVHAGRCEEIPNPGRYVTREIGGESLIILNGGRGSGIGGQEQNRDQGSGIRDQEQNEGNIRAFFNVCRHRGTRLCTDPEGELQRVIKCPYHAWTYDLTGRLVAASLMPDGFNKDDYPLHPVPAATWDGHIFVNLSQSSRPLEDQLADLPAKFAPWRMDELRLMRRITYDVAANWKLIILNFNECLHCPVIHPILNRLTNYLGADNEQPKPTYIGGTMGFTPGVETMSTDGRRRRSYLPGLGPRERELVAYYVVYPNLLLSLHPDYMLTHTIWPMAPDRTRIVCEWHFHPDQIAAPDFEASDVVEFWDTTNREDWAIIERAQLGIRSRANTPGPYSTREALLHAFDEWVLGKLSDA